jgi:hypothetical protein
MANVKITSYVDALQRRQDELVAASQSAQDAAVASSQSAQDVANDAKHAAINEKAERANWRLDKGVHDAYAQRPTLSRDLREIATPPPHGPGMSGVQPQIDWINEHLHILAEAVLAMVEAHATGPKKEGAPPS